MGRKEGDDSEEEQGKGMKWGVWKTIKSEAFNSRTGLVWAMGEGRNFGRIEGVLTYLLERLSLSCFP